MLRVPITFHGEGAELLHTSHLGLSVKGSFSCTGCTVLVIEIVESPHASAFVVRSGQKESWASSGHFYRGGLSSTQVDCTCTVFNGGYSRSSELRSPFTVKVLNCFIPFIPTSLSQFVTAPVDRNGAPI